MNVGDWIKLMPKPKCQNLDVPQDQIGIIRNIDRTCERTALLISFPEVDVYTSALDETDIEVVASETR
jgi:hypothetical protein